MSQSSIISVQHLNHYFGKGSLRKQVLFDISLSINPGEIVILTGPSGSGKTTLLSLMAGLRSVQEGSVKVFGKEVYRAGNKKLLQLRRQIGYVFQKHNLVPFLTASQNVQMTMELARNMSRKEMCCRAEAMLELVGLNHRIHYYPDQLSEGQKQRVAFARALVTQPQLILADEPTASLDKNSTQIVVETLKERAKYQGCSILLITHDNRILDMADRIIYMEDGYLKNDVRAA
ncbi:ABC transporter-like protein [Trichormus variabilis ATCC 29413]|uniref:ABC transporter-like protein n=2 Tax=Anabaena variabilis TaxID=264691 RepID=Q3M5N0_TRIV2|nr:MULTISPECIES: DevA family ABC transporter ATP-binding protein [Nostocaceae]ABA23706.1 ABC transporter-like protein [Trichormus variabilis ATCC 29413]MBC1213132.1 DevA family ABC transporter ATP-binding protein [Trichormus variabilis ARAD]MBC1254463.1 DevA family ABC transporter ATP-binding protein [Trichormus variabilis V5]MBC1265562.1 DevA family ABC transporter ATP-binding protein [Trichormus variabilis FSR]MBC1301767.1 DevA family ABC transporter ATP-binding protein [Trichormus variabili